VCSTIRSHEGHHNSQTNTIFRYYDMMEETYLINDVKEACCYVSNDVFKDLSICR